MLTRKIYELPTSKTGENEHIETKDFLLNELKIDPTIDNNAYDLLLRNYIFYISQVTKDLQLIEHQLDYIDEQMNKTKNQYQIRKYKYFRKINLESKSQIVNFFHNDLHKELEDSSSDYINDAQEGSATSILLKCRYDYAHFSEYYSPNYDYNTHVKVRFLFPEDLLDTFSKINEYINLRKDDPVSFQLKMQTIVLNDNLLHKITDNVKNNYYLNKREEIFETLIELFKAEKYLTFITLATLQLEGMFYDLCLIKYGEKDNMGTLIEKVEKAFKDNPYLWRPLYPYFAFDIPNLRNEVAHNGMVSDIDLKATAFSLVLDLNCILECILAESLDRFKHFYFVNDALNKISHSAADYQMQVDKTLFKQLAIVHSMAQQDFWDILKDSNNFQDEIDFYSPNLKKIIVEIRKRVQSKSFWQYILNLVTENQYCKDNTFILKLVNTLIPILTNEAKANSKAVYSKINGN